MAEEKKNGTTAAVEPAGERRISSLIEQMDREFDDLRRRMRSLFRRPEATPAEPGALPAVWAPTADAYTADNTLIVKAELPGVKVENITITLQGGRLTIEGERSEEKETKDAQYHAAERFRGYFSRSFSVPAGVDPDAVTAEYRDGVLQVRVPLPAAAPVATSARIPIKG